MPAEFHCQICARAIKAKHGLIAHHGYRRPTSGWQTASCLGARQAPYEVSRDRIRYVVDKVVKPWLQSQRKLLKDWVDNPPAEIKIQPMRFGFKDGEPRVYVKPDNFVPPVKAEGSWSPATYEGQHTAQRYVHEREIRSATDDITFLEKRYAEWVAPR